MSALNLFFEKANNSPEGKIWSQQLWLNHQKNRPLVFANPNGKSTNGHPFEGELDLNLRAGKTSHQYALGFIKIDAVTYDLIVFPSKRKGIAMLKYDGYLSTGRLSERKKFADVEVMEFVNPTSHQCSYSLRLKPPRPLNDSTSQEVDKANLLVATQIAMATLSKRGWSERPF